MIDWIRMNKSITRAQTADLCRISPRQASYLLSNMLKNSKLKKVGTRRGARYVLPKYEQFEQSYEQ